MKITKEITLDVSRLNRFQSIIAKQNDKNSRYLRVSVADEGNVLIIPSNSKVTITATRPDKLSSSFLGEVTKDGKAIVPLTPWMLEIDGSLSCEVSIITEESVLKTTSFKVEVEPDESSEESDITQEPNYDILVELIQEVTEIVEAVEQTIPNAVDKYLNQGEANAGKTLVVGSDGKIALSDKTSQLDKRVTNLEQGIVPSPFETDNTVAYIKIVPENALPYAEISKVGGMTRKCTNLIPYPYFDDTKTVNGITFTNNGDGSVTINGTATNTADFFLFKNNNDIVKLAKGTTYASNMPNGCRLMGYDAIQGAYPVLSIGGSSTTTSKTFSLNQVYISVTSGITLNNIKLYPMLNEGTTALPYEPYFEGLRSAPVTEVESKGVNGVISTFPIPESVQALDGYGWGVSESVYNYIDFDKKQFIKKVEKVDFNGRESWAKFGPSQYGLPHESLKSSSTSECLSDRFKFGFATTSGSFFVGSSGMAFNTIFDTLDEWEAYLAEQYSNGTPVTIYAELATPIITDISDMLSDDNYIEVESGGTVTMVNEFEHAVPSEITYQIKGDA